MRTRTAVLSITLLMLIALGAWAWSSRPFGERTSAPAPAPTQVQVAKAVSQHLPRYLDSLGTLEAGEQVLVSAEVGGKVERLDFDSGQSVTRGQVLVSLNSAPERAEADHQRALLANAQKRLKRIRELMPAGAVAKEDLDNAQMDLDAAKALLAKTEAVIAQKTIRAPFSGELGIRKVHVGQYVNAGDPVASLINRRELRVNFSLDEQASAQVVKGQEVLLNFRALPGEDYKARILTLDPLLDNTRMSRIQAVLSTPGDTLRPGMSADVRVVQATQAATLVVPATAIVSSAYGDVVYRIERTEAGAQVHRVAVKAGTRADGWRVVSEGLEEGDEVVAVGQNRLSDGQAVQPSAAAAQAHGRAQAEAQGARHAFH
ncbi:efflux RND transporter periplasmic adaptor subunit [Pseudomonas sp. S75]|uniref:efflux RND transporter periplasmic adaptor subunit n=1 Tax=unclassified Pseudomonas TaxID=196821 RepID=UPI001908E5F3|nr:MULTISPECIES: efflux RND transporter periplasmic adaptor subunit [unclassified Pseudomonas]MBJ9977094.1 efflux RND transporter periplasmic adaptor subunit [Pseudomonas sp. S30]MBK0154096.1 efflux RND transporter periplasmic adaptor subunit [Pseudomonas sp. S75]